LPHFYTSALPSALRLKNVDQVINGSVTSDCNVRRIDAIFAHDSLNLAVVDVCQGYGAGDIEATLVLLPEGDVGGFLIDADSETLEFRLNHPLIRQRLIDIQHNEDQMACLSNGDDLSTSTSTILGTLNDTGKVNNLQGGTWRNLC